MAYLCIWYILKLRPYTIPARATETNFAGCASAVVIMNSFRIISIADSLLLRLFLLRIVLVYE